jgi:probable O-glycosylation ligase (exosortase A-associated)
VSRRGAVYIGIVLTAVVLFSLPFCFLRPWVGVLMWAWIGYMNPHRLTWSFSYDMKYAQMVAIATLGGLLVTGDRRRLPQTRETFLLMGLWLLFTLSTAFALYPDLAREQWEKVSKVLLFTLITLVVCQERARLRYIVLTVALSLGYYGFKGGIFVMRTGGQHQVIAPEDTFIGGNTGLGLALNMALPMFFFLAREEQSRWLRRLLRAMFWLTIPAILFSYSRGAVLALGAVVLSLAAKMNRKGLALVVLIGGALIVSAVAPEKWISRMETLRTYDQDQSAVGRLEAWSVFYRVGLDRPLLGAGFYGPSSEEIFFRYLPTAKEYRNAHNSFVNILGEHGVIAFVMFISLIASCFWTLRRVRRLAKTAGEASWIQNYAQMFEVSLIGYVVAGMFLSMAYLDLFYHTVAFVVLLRVVAEREAGSSSQAMDGASGSMDKEIGWSRGRATAPDNRVFDFGKKGILASCRNEAVRP